MAAGLAEKLAGEGYTVDLVTVLETISPYSDETLEGSLLRQHLHDVGVSMRANVSLDAVNAGSLQCSSFGDPIEIGADAVVLVTQRLSNDELYLELRATAESLRSAGVEALYRIGDCVSPRLLADVAFDGHRLGREIDSDNPAIPLPYLRERLVPQLIRN
jgi:dimethylamine/trimethylamine dehydrogenase